MGTKSVGSRPCTLRATQSTNSNMFLTAFSTILPTSVSISSLGDSAQFSQTEVSGTAKSKSCRLAHPNGRDFYDLRGVGDHVFEASADTSVPFGPALWNARVVMRLCDNVGGCDNTPAPAVLLLEPFPTPRCSSSSPL